MERIRVFFSKKDEAAYISHLDLQRVMARGLRKSEMPVWFSKGFNPHIYMTFSLPLPLMQHSDAETMDCKTEAENIDFKQFIVPLNNALPKGIFVSKIDLPKYKAEEINMAEYHISYAGEDELLKKAIDKYNKLSEALVIRKTKRTQQEEDLKQAVPLLQTAKDKTDTVIVRLPAGGVVNYNPELLTKFLEAAAGLPAEKAHILRTKVFVKDGNIFC